MFKQFATVNIDPSIKNNSDLHVVNVVFPPDQRSSDILQNVSFYKSFIHDFRIETSDEKASLLTYLILWHQLGVKSKIS